MSSLFALLIFLALGFVQPPARSPAELGWLAGCWEMREGERVTVEQWMEPAGNLMLGMSRTVRGGKAIEFEFLRIIQDPDGSVYYIAMPSGQRETRFKLVESAPRKLVFENLQHDFPQRIRYQQKEDGSLLASIEGTSSGRQRKVEFPLRRVSCAGQ